jgi:hypothetical protein
VSSTNYEVIAETITHTPAVRRLLALFIDPLQRITIYVLLNNEINFAFMLSL